MRPVVVNLVDWNLRYLHVSVRTHLYLLAAEEVLKELRSLYGLEVIILSNCLKRLEHLG